jgi:iron complex outermembrane recepter protein
MKLIFLLFVSLIVSPFANAGTNSEDSATTFTLEPVVVTATKSATEQKNVATAISVITNEELISSGDPQLLSVISSRVPGMYIQERGILGYGISTASGEISMRGLGGDPNTEVLVLIDGSPQFMGLFGHPLADMYRTEDVSKVEVIRGPASVLYGSNAMGGVINIITKNPEHSGLSGGADASYETFNTQQLTAHAAESGDGESLSISGGHYQTDGQRPSSSFNQNDLFAKERDKINDQISLTADLDVTKYDAYDPGPASAPTPNNWYSVFRGEAGISADTKFSRSDGEIKVFYDWGKHKIFNGFQSSDDMLSVQLYNTVRMWPENVLTVGVDYENYGGSANDVVNDIDYGSHNVQEEAGYLFVQQFLSPQLVLNGGLRLNIHSVYGSEVVPQIGLAMQATDATTVKASISKGFRSPTIRELYLFPAPTPDLQPERAWDYETGVDQTLGERATAEVVLFLMQGNNLIEANGVYPNLTLSNSGEFVHRGVETSLMYRLTESLQGEASYSYLSTGNDTRANPRHKLFVGTTYTQGIVSLNLNDEYIAKLYGDNFSRELLPSYDLLHLSATIRPVPTISIRLSADNLLNESYQTIFDYPMPGRTYTVGISATY